jgi:Phage integrase family
MANQIGIDMHSVSGYKMVTNLIEAKVSSYSKTDLRFWQDAVFRHVRRVSGKRYEDSDYSVRVQYKGQRGMFALGTPNRTSAAARARDIYFYLSANGWEKTLAKYKPKAVEAANEPMTVGDLIREVQASAPKRGRTLDDYVRSFRHIVADIFSIPGGTKKYDYRAGGRQNWLERVDAVKLQNLTPALIQQWKLNFLDRADANPASQRAARISVNSFLRQARSLFSPKRLGFTKLTGLRSPFEGVRLEPRQSMRYRSSFKIQELVEQAMAELDQEELKVFLLASMAGLRRNEIDKLPWTAFNWDRGTLRVEVTEHFDTKSEHSIGEVDLDPEFVALFRQFRAKAVGPLVVYSNVRPRPNARYSHYRCKQVFGRMTDWLRSKGVPGNRPLHALRKEFGSQICEQFGIYAASRALRHADIGITAQHYLDKRTRVTVGFGKLLLRQDSISPG